MIYDDPYSEILNKIVKALEEANFHSHNMSEGEFFVFKSLAETIATADPHVDLPNMQ